ncbi:MAG: nucleoside deaminase [Bacteroidales bacterium]
MHDKEIFLKESIKLAEKNLSTNNGGPFGAVVVKQGKIIGRGINTVTSTNDPTAHAEVNAIRDACNNLNTFQLEGCEIYCSCEPCPMCLGAIYWARPKKLFFASNRVDAAQAGFDDSRIYEEIKLDFKDRKIETQYIPLKEGKELFEAWKIKENKTNY